MSTRYTGLGLPGPPRVFLAKEGSVPWTKKQAADGNWVEKQASDGAYAAELAANGDWVKKKDT